MNPGTLSDRVSFSAPSGGTRTDFGSKVPIYASIGKRWAEVEALQGRELLLAQQASSEVTYKVRMRKWSRVTKNCRLEWDGTTLHVENVLPTGPDENTLLCREVTLGQE